MMMPLEKMLIKVISDGSRTPTAVAYFAIALNIARIFEKAPRFVSLEALSVSL